MWHKRLHNNCINHRASDTLFVQLKSVSPYNLSANTTSIKLRCKKATYNKTNDQLTNHLNHPNLSKNKYIQFKYFKSLNLLICCIFK